MINHQIYSHDHLSRKISLIDETHVGEDHSPALAACFSASLCGWNDFNVPYISDILYTFLLRGN